MSIATQGDIGVDVEALREEVKTSTVRLPAIPAATITFIPAAISRHISDTMTTLSHRCQTWPSSRLPG